MEERTTPSGDDLKYGPFANGCGFCGATLLVGMKQQHIKWHQRLEGKDAEPVEEGYTHQHSVT